MSIPMPSFVLPPNGVVSPDTLTRRRQMAEAMLRGGIDTSPIQSPWQGAARIAQSLMGGIGMANADRQEAQGRKSANEALVKELAGDDDKALADYMSNPYASSGGISVLEQQWKNAHPSTMAMQDQYFQPQLFQDPKTGQLKYIQPSKMQGIDPREVVAPEGYSPLVPQTYLDTGTGYIPQQTKTVPGQAQPVPKNVAEKAAQEATGKGLAERGLDQPRAKLALGNTLNSLDRLEGIADSLSNHPGLSWITGEYGLIPDMPGKYSLSGGEASNAQAQFTNLKSNVTVDVLNAMRETSKTGGALGNVTNYEDQLLASYLAALDQAQDYPSMKAALQKISEYAKGARQRLQKAYDETYPSAEGSEPEAIAPAPEPAPESAQSGGATYKYDADGNRIQ